MTPKGKKICFGVMLILLLGISGFFYYWWQVYIPQQGFVPDKPINVLEDDGIEGNYYPRPKPPTHLFSINDSKLDGEEKVLILSLMGVLAKSAEGPKIYIEDDGGSYSLWAKEISKQNITVTTIEDPWWLVANLGVGNISGYILYKADRSGVQSTSDPILSSDTLSYQHQDESFLVAASLAGIMNACMVEVSNESQAQALGLTMVFDALGKDVKWLFASDYFNQLRKDMIFEVEHHTSRRYFLIDYAIFCNAPVWHAQTHSERAEYLKKFEADSPSFGWGAVGPMDEAGLNLQVTVAGGFFMPSDWARCLSTLSAIQVPTKQKPLPTLPSEENVHYVTIIMSDGDNLQWAMGGFMDPKFYGSSKRGQFAMGWTIPPAMTDLCPIVLKYYYESASEKDRFVAGVSGHGLIYNAKHPWHEIHVNRSGPILNRSDIKVVTIQDFGWQKQTFEPTLNLPEVSGVIYMDYRQYALQAGKSMWINQKPAISFTYNFWLGFDSASGIALSVNTGSRNIRSASAYSSIVVHAWSHGMDDIAEMVSQFGSHVRVVDPETFIALYTQNVPKIDAFAFNIVKFVALYGQYVLIVVGISIAVIMTKRLIKSGKLNLKLKFKRKPVQIEKTIDQSPNETDENKPN